MVNKCVVGNCNNSNLTGHSVHEFPKEPVTRQKWKRFVRNNRADWTHATATSIICGSHFVAPGDFEGFVQWKMGFRRKLDVKKSAVPSTNTTEAKAIRLPANLRKWARSVVGASSLVRVYTVPH